MAAWLWCSNLKAARWNIPESLAGARNGVGGKVRRRVNSCARANSVALVRPVLQGTHRYSSVEALEMCNIGTDVQERWQHLETELADTKAALKRLQSESRAEHVVLEPAGAGKQLRVMAPSIHNTHHITLQVIVRTHSASQVTRPSTPREWCSILQAYKTKTTMPHADR